MASLIFQGHGPLFAISSAVQSQSHPLWIYPVLPRCCEKWGKKALGERCRNPRYNRWAQQSAVCGSASDYIGCCAQMRLWWLRPLNGGARVSHPSVLSDQCICAYRPFEPRLRRQPGQLVFPPIGSYKEALRPEYGHPSFDLPVQPCVLGGRKIDGLLLGR